MERPIDLALNLDARKLPSQVFERLTKRSILRRDRAQCEREAWENFGKPNRDPAQLGGTLDAIAVGRQWVPHLKVAQLRTHWDEVVGAGIAAHSYVDDFRDGVLTIHTESGAWATQLTYLIPALTQTIRERLEGLEVKEIKVTGPRTSRFAQRYRHRGYNR
ncbi:DUF721 domain-containing protein [Bifidobacterium bombi]|nr:DUF721 domain-containing protein [Bifidobacterium bombi]